jgi:hypothetical protein
MVATRRVATVFLMDAPFARRIGRQSSYAAPERGAPIFTRTSVLVVHKTAGASCCVAASQRQTRRFSR